MMLSLIWESSTKRGSYSEPITWQRVADSFYYNMYHVMENMKRTDHTQAIVGAILSWKRSTSCDKPVYMYFLSKSHVLQYSKTNACETAEIFPVTQNTTTSITCSFQASTF